MDKQQIREQLEQLHAELQEVGSVDSQERELLQSLASDIRDILERAEDQAQTYGGLGTQLKGAVAQLEASHPRTTLLMRQVIDQLSYMGI
jgi:hypothetical protein